MTSSYFDVPSKLPDRFKKNEKDMKSTTDEITATPIFDGYFHDSKPQNAKVRQKIVLFIEFCRSRKADRFDKREVIKRTSMEKYQSQQKNTEKDMVLNIYIYK